MPKAEKPSILPTCDQAIYDWLVFHPKATPEEITLLGDFFAHFYYSPNHQHLVLPTPLEDENSPNDPLATAVDTFTGAYITSWHRDTPLSEIVELLGVNQDGRANQAQQICQQLKELPGFDLKGYTAWAKQ